MVEIVKTYHENPQKECLPMDESVHAQKMEKILSILDKSLSKEYAKEIGEEIMKMEVEEAIKQLLSSKAAGLDSIPQELWKELASRFQQRKEDESESFDLAQMLTSVYNNIMNHSISDGTNFAERWLCPIYKKGDKTDLRNYRPITVLNTDYKILTKILSVQLSNIAPEIIYTNQAGFMKRQCIKKQTELAHLMIKRCKETGENSMIVCLNQEKAYDNILHSFLWALLHKFNFSEKFIKIIQKLYRDANMTVMLNGELITPLKVTRK